jgi:hypothetical protein
MKFLTDPEFIKLFVFGCAFFVGVGVCLYVVIKETAELNHRRRAKKLMYEDQVRQELERKKFILEQIRQHDSAPDPKNSGPDPIDLQKPMHRTGSQSFA